MKKTILLFLPILIAFSACKKYQDGPEFSLNSKRHRVENVWVIEKVMENGVDKTSDYENLYYGFSWIIDKSSKYIISYSAYNALPYSEMGIWDFNKSKTHLIFKNDDPNAQVTISNDWTIYRLKEKELWISATNWAGLTVEMHLIPK